MNRIRLTELLITSCHNKPPILLKQNGLVSSQVRKASFIDWLKETDEDNSGKVFDVFKNRITQEMGDRLEKRRQNGFKLFDIEEKFDIDQFKLQREMRKLQKILHPDKFVGKSLKTQQISIELSAMVNDFYRTLSHPYERGKYLLTLMTNTNEDEMEKKLGSIKLDGEFLARMMDISERVRDSSPNDTVTLRKLSSDLDKDLAELTNKLREDFAAKRYDDIYKNLGKLKFVANCHMALADRLGSLEDF